MHSLKTKLAVTISALVVVLFTLTAFLFIHEKQRELTQDIFVQARSLAQLTAPAIVADYKLYLEQQSFVYFNREIQDIFQKFSDLESLQVVTYSGDLVYDSRTEQAEQYQGAVRKMESPVLMQQIKAKNPSVFTLDTQRTVYLKQDAEGNVSYVDMNEQPVDPLKVDEKIAYLVQPAANDLSIIYAISYANLQERVNQTIMRGVLIAVFGVGIGLLLAFVYAGGITKPLQQLTEGAEVIAKGDFKHRVEVKTKDEIFTLASAFNKMAGELDLSTKALVYKERVAKELELAAKIQKQLLPREIPQMASLDISAGLLPAEEIGGDCYDFIKTDPDSLLMYLGDVTGHGVPSGIVVAIANALIYNHAYNAENITDIKSLLIKVNRVLKEKTSSNMFMTLVMLYYNEVSKKLKYVSAGHEQMIHFHAADKKVTLSPAGGLALGMFPDIAKNLNEYEIQLEKDDALIIYSDGIPECWKNEKEMFGMANFKRVMSEYGDLPSAMAIRNAILAEVKTFAGGYKQMDDITLVVLKKK